MVGIHLSFILAGNEPGGDDGMFIWLGLTCEIPGIHRNRTAHFSGKTGMIFPFTKSPAPFFKGHCAAFLSEHAAQFFSVSYPVAIFLDDIFQAAALRLWALLLLQSGISEYKHGSREDVLRQMKKILVCFTVFHDISDITGTDPHAPGSGDSILGGDIGIRYGKHQLPHARFAGLAAAFFEGIIPLPKICTENQNHSGFGDEWLMVATYG